MVGKSIFRLIKSKINNVFFPIYVNLQDVVLKDLTFIV